MGLVYRALDEDLGREVALKSVRPDRSDNPGYHKRLLREAKAASRLSHPAIVTILEVFEHQGLPWIAMELVEGVTLRRALLERGPLPLQELLHHAEDLTDALRAAHSRKVLHRDVNPNNVLVTRDGRARLTDFGLARFYVAPGEESQASTESSGSESGHVVGTPGYMSPEQVLGKHVDPRSDIFCLGLVLYEMSTGKPAFSVSADGDLTDAILNREPTAIARLNYEIPDELERIVRKAINKRPDERYQEAREMLADVRALRRRVESGSYSGVASPAPPQPLRRAWVLTGVGAAALAALGLGWWVTKHWRDDPAPPLAIPRQLTTGPSSEFEPALSPDGSTVAYTSDRSGNLDIWIIDVHGGTPLRLTSEVASDHSPAWFPDSSALAFVSDRSGVEAIWKMPRFGGVPVLLLPDAQDPAVSPDGKRVAFSRPDASGHPRVHVASLSDPSRATRLTEEADGLWYHRHPSWSPDGRTICYETFKDLWVVSTDGQHSPRRLTTSHESDREPVYSYDGRYIYFSAYRDGTKALWRIAAEGGDPQRLSLGSGSEGQPSVDRSGTRLAYSTYSDSQNLALLNLRTGRRVLWPGLRHAGFPSLSPDGTTLLFTSDQMGRSDLWVQSLSGDRPAGEPTRRTDQAGSIGTFSVSSDARWIAYHRNLDGERDIWIMPFDGGLSRNFTSHPSFDIHPAWSPDDSRLAFVSDRDGHHHVWIAPVTDGAPTGPPIRITSGARTDMFPSWSPDGREIAFIGGQGSEWDVWIKRVGDSSVARRVTSGAGAKRVQWDRASPGALLVSGLWGAQRTEIRRVSSDRGRQGSLAAPVVFGGPDAVGDFSMAPDGKLLAYIEEEVHGDVWVLEAAQGRY